MTTTTVKPSKPHVATRPRRRPHRHRERLARLVSNELHADLRYLVGPELAGGKGDWPDLKRRKQNWLRWLMDDGTGDENRPVFTPWNTPSSGLVGDFAVTIQDYHAWHERREPVSVVLPLRLATSDATAAGWMRTAGEAQSEPQPA